MIEKRFALLGWLKGDTVTDISVVIPVGPKKEYLEWLPECIESVMNQTHKPKEIIIVDDSCGVLIDESINHCFGKGRLKFIDLFGLPADECCENSVVKENKTEFHVDGFPIISYFKTPWNVGVADAFNFGVGLSTSNLVFMLGSDDKLMPTCLEEVVKEYDKQQIEGWYNVTLVTSTGEESWIPNNAAATTRKLWKWVGGFPPSAGVAACDAVVLSILMKHAPERIVQVKQGTPLYWGRVHEHQDTRHNMAYFATSGIVEVIRNLETQRWEPRDE